MALVKCPRCELNYMQATDKYCKVCSREITGDEDHDLTAICTNCGDRLSVAGEELCAVCLKEITSTEGFSATSDSDDEAVDETAIGMPGATEIEEIAIDDEAIPAGEFQVIKREFGDEDEAEFETVSLSELKEEEAAADEDEDD